MLQAEIYTWSFFRLSKSSSSWPSISSLLNFNISDLKAQLMCFTCSLVQQLFKKKYHPKSPTYQFAFRLCSLSKSTVRGTWKINYVWQKHWDAFRKSGIPTRKYWLEMEHTVMLSQDFCVCQNMAGNMCWNLYFTNNGHCRLRTGRLRTWQIMDMVDFVRSKLHLDVVKMAAEWRDLPKKDHGLNLRPPASRLSHQQKAIQSFHSISQSFSQRHPHHLHTAASSFDCSQWWMLTTLTHCFTATTDKNLIRNTFQNNSTDQSKSFTVTVNFS